MATAKRSNAQREPQSQKPGTDRNSALAELAASAAVVDQAPRTVEVPLPVHTGRVRDLGGDVTAVVVTPWAVVEGHTLFRGDHVKASAELVDGNDSLTRI